MGYELKTNHKNGKDNGKGRDKLKEASIEKVYVIVKNSIRNPEDDIVHILQQQGRVNVYSVVKLEDLSTSTFISLESDYIDDEFAIVHLRDSFEAYKSEVSKKIEDLYNDKDK